MKILIPTQSFRDWQRLLAKPDLHWKAGYSAMTLARSWDAAAPTGFPPEIRAALDASGAPSLKGLAPLLAIPEYQVPLRGGDNPSQTDVLALARGSAGLVAIAVEGKVDEPFGPTLAEKLLEPSQGFKDRLTFLLGLLRLPDSVSGSIRYQLLHRTASALLIAEQFNARVAVMIVHSFSTLDRWFPDFQAFAALFHAHAEIGQPVPAGEFAGISLFLGWCRGDQIAVRRMEDDDDAYFTDVAKTQPFRLGHTMEVVDLADEQDPNVGLLVQVREGRRTAWVPLSDLEVCSKDDVNFWPVREYVVWSANR